MALTQTFIINNTFLGTEPRKLQPPGPDYQLPWSALFFCGQCGKTYGFCPISNGDQTLPFQAYRGCCDGCPSNFAFTVPGSVWQGWNTEYLLAMPRELLLRELNLHIAHIPLLELPR